MPTTVNLRKILDRKQWEPLAPLPNASAAASFVISSSLTNRQLFVVNATTIYMNDPSEDASVLLPASGLTGTFGAGSCGYHHPAGPSGTSTGSNSSTTLRTNLTLPGDLGPAGFTLRLTGGTGAGQERVVSANTVGANSVFTVSSAWDVTPDATTTYTLMSGRWFIWNAGTSTTFGFRYYDTATGTWSSELTKASVGATWGTDGRLLSPVTGPLATGTATGGSTSTLVNSAKAWATNQWTNMQVRITAGTGAGQVRTVASNTGTTLTVSTNFAVAPDATSAYVLEGDENALYLLGNNAVTLYKYNISANTWATLAPAVARSGAPGVALWAGVVSGSDDPTYTPENAILNGRRLFSLRGGGTNTLDYYDIPSNSWVNAVPYLRQNETFTTGSSYSLVGDDLYISKEATGRWFRLDLAKLRIDPWSTMVYPQGAALAGDRAFDISYTDGGTTIRWICSWLNTSTYVFRCMVI